MMNESTKKDLLRYKKNSAAAILTYFAIIFDVLFFASLYSSDYGTSTNIDMNVVFYKWLIGISVVYNLLFLLAGFLCSEGIKNYKKGYSYVLIVMGVLQVARIFIIPTIAAFGSVERMFEVGIFSNFNFSDTQAPIIEGIGLKAPIINEFKFYYMCCCLLASAALCIIAGVNSFIKSTTLQNYMAELKKKGVA